MLLKHRRLFPDRINSTKAIFTTIKKRNYQRKTCGPQQMNIAKPLSRAQHLAIELDQIRYQFPKIPRPKRNFGYYYNLKGPFQNRSFYSTSQKPQQARREKRFRQIFTLTSISVIFYGIASRVKTKDDELIRPTKDHSWKFYAYSTLPLKSLSRLWGKVNNIELPIWLRTPGYKCYSYLFGVNLDEISEKDLTKYKNLAQFFYRTLEPGARPILDSLMVSPCDGKVLKFGIVENGEIEQIKGMTYSVDSLLGEATNLKKKIRELDFKQESHDIVQRDEEFARLNGISYTVEDLVGNNQGYHFNKDTTFKSEGDATLRKASTSHIDKLDAELQAEDSKQLTKVFFTVIYLAPGDYHRFHSPVNWVTTLRRHFIGELYSVAPIFQQTLKDLFILNERVSLLGYWKHGFFSMTPVGATNVGSIKINFDKNLVTNNKYEDGTDRSKTEKNTCYEASYRGASSVLKGIPLLKGEEVGGFELGSTVVLVFEAPENFKFQLENNQYLKMGQRIGDAQPA